MQAGTIRLEIQINGIVQGVGFRPFISKLSNEYFLSGFIKNTSEGVTIEVEGNENNIFNFINDIQRKAPPLSMITGISNKTIETKNSKSFEIISSEDKLGNRTLISPDVSICNDCLEELFNPSNRRFKYPFINCTNCGPRLTIIENIPYDRKQTTMKNFLMCEDCSREYHDINDRRYHAQPNACPKCGPKIWYENNDIISTEFQVIEKIVDQLIEGKIMAIKGLGGFHLAVDAYNDDAVKKLRERKRREEKPFAVMVKNLEHLYNIVELDETEKKLISHFSSPILLLKKKNSEIAESIAPNNRRLGVMLAYTPLHHILLDELERKHKNFPPVLIMTSANFSEEPIEISNTSAKERLNNVADGFVFHNRDILIRADDSVAIFTNSKKRIIRRSRGFVPRPFFLKKKYYPVLGVGAELKNTICLLKDDKGFISQHIGDLTNLSANNFFNETINYFQKILDHRAEYIAYDLHPDYTSTRWALENNLPSFGVQHHHAHMAACMGEYNLAGDVIGIILDGTGYGLDHSIWGGEILIGGFTKIKRFSFLEPIAIPGGDAAIKEPWRIALAYLYHTYKKHFPYFEFINSRHTDVLIHMLEKKINSPLTSSAGRLFDAVSVLCGGPKIIRYEAQAAIELMQKIGSLDYSNYDIDEEANNQTFIPLQPLIKNVVNDVMENIPVNIISTKFHKTFSQMLINKTLRAREETKINDVVLSGGVFQNEFLLTIMENELKKLNFNFYSHSNIPTNDGGISFGQALVANELIEKGMDKVYYEL